MSDQFRLVSLEGPVELIDGKLTLTIPLAVGGENLFECCRGIAKIRGENLVISLPDWMGAKLHIADGSFVVLDNENGKLNIRKKLAN